jgi:CRP-like cAMP-binding protein
LAAKRRKTPSDLGNLILGAMPSEARVRLAARLKIVDVAGGSVVCDAGALVREIYFPRTCVLSLLGLSRSGDAVETAFIGREGAFGLVAGMRGRETHARCQVKIGGTAYRLPAADFKREFDRSAAVRAVVLDYLAALTALTQQTVVCNTFHPAKARLARSLLMMRDGTGADLLGITQELLAGVLGLSRTTVTEAARALQSAGAISYRRGLVQVVSSDRLADAACECYETVRSLVKVPAKA